VCRRNPGISSRRQALPWPPREATRKSDLKGAAKGMYESMNKSQLEELASTKHTGKPEKKT
jgi:hypothetical protein